MNSEQSISETRPKNAKPKFPEPGQLWTVPQIARKLQLSQSTIIRMITAGSMPALCVRSGKRKKMYRVRSEVLDKWVLTKERETQRTANE